MLKTLSSIVKRDKEKFRIPKSVQDTIPIKAIYDDGIFMVGKDKFSKCYKFTDINYVRTDMEDRQNLFLAYCNLLNSFDTGTTAKITLFNRKLNTNDFEANILLPQKNDELKIYRDEYNKMLTSKAKTADSIVQEKFITISVYRRNIEDARSYFNRVTSSLISHFKKLGSTCTELDANERLRIFHDFYRVEDVNNYFFKVEDAKKKGHNFKDNICPDGVEFHSSYFKMDERFGRVLFLKDYASSIKDELLRDITDLNRNLVVSMDIISIPSEEARHEISSKMLGVSTNATNWQQRQTYNGNFSAVLPYQYTNQQNTLTEYDNDIASRNQKMMQVVLTIVHTAETKEQLDNDTDTLKSLAANAMCQFGLLRFQQLEGLNTALPFGTRKIDAFRTLLTEGAAAFMPFRVQDIYHKGGIYFGQNQISNNMILIDRSQLMNGNSIVLGTSGGGKSFCVKEEIVSLMCSGDADIIIIDPEREYGRLVKALGGEVINISATSPHHINALDMNKGYGDGADPIIFKAEFIMSLFAQIVGDEYLGAKEKSIIDRCTYNVYREYQKNGYSGKVPTLIDFREELLKQLEPEAQELALKIELYSTGSFGTFAKPTNVDYNNRLVCYDILELGANLRSMGMLVILDSILNRIIENREKGKFTYIFIDEIYLLFQHQYSANFLYTLWKRVRKYGAYATGITQNVGDFLQSHTARTMVSNSEFLIMLNQSPQDREELASLLSIPRDLEKAIENAEIGSGLIKFGKSIVPFYNRFPKDTELYKLMTTKAGEVV